MNVKNLFTATAIINSLFGILLIFAPTMMTQEYLTNSSLENDATVFLGRLLGSVLISIGIAGWIARNTGPSIARRALLILTSIGSLGNCIIHIIAITGNVEKSFAWGTVLLAIILTIWGGQLLMKEKDTIN